MKRKSRNFPDNGSNHKQSNESILSEIGQIKAELQNKNLSDGSLLKQDESVNVEKTQVFNNNTKGTINQNSGDVLLGDLLGYLRENRLMSTLMVCRQIEKVEIENNVASLYSSTTDLTELVKNERQKIELDEFFKSKGLSFKILEKKNEVNPIDTLKEFFGEKLIVK